MLGTVVIKAKVGPLDFYFSRQSECPAGSDFEPG